MLVIDIVFEREHVIIGDGRRCEERKELAFNG